MKEKKETIMQRIIPILCIILSACGFVSEGMPMDESSSSSSGDGSDDPTILTTATTTSSSTTTSESSSDGSSGSDDGESSSSSDDETSAESTGERTVDYALRFDGTSYARKVQGEDPFLWPSGDFTVEVWINIESEDATGVIFDTANDAFTSGWVFYLHNDMHALVFSVFDETHFNQVIVGPDVAEIGTGWHHIAAVKSDDMVSIYADGLLAVEQVVSPTMSFDNEASWILGGAPGEDPEFYLHDVVVDDLRIVAQGLYQGDFDPPVMYDDEPPSILTLLLDEGDGLTAEDPNSGSVFDVESPVWTPGNSE